MPKWGACWGMARVANFLHPERDWDQDVGHRDIYIIYCAIDHVGVVESADPGVFIYAVQEVIHILLDHRNSILPKLGDDSVDVYKNLLEAAFRMRELAAEQRRAFWTSGYEADRVRLMETMRRCQLPEGAPEFMLARHIERIQHALHRERIKQGRRLHDIAGSGLFDNAINRRLRQIPPD